MIFAWYLFPFPIWREQVSHRLEIKNMTNKTKKKIERRSKLIKIFKRLFGISLKFIVKDENGKRHFLV